MTTRTWSGLLLAAVLGLAGPAEATTWFDTEVDCPVCKTRNTVSEIGSYGSYIYQWPSRCQFIFWPATDDHAVFACSHCGYSTLMQDFAKLPADKHDAVKKALQGHSLPEATDYTRIPMTARLAAAEKVYSAWGRTDAEWAFFFRVVAYHAEEEGDAPGAAAARRRALAYAEKVAADPSKAGGRKESLVITGSLRSFLGDKEGAGRDLAEAAKLTLEPADEKSKGKDAYLDKLIADLQAGLAGPEPRPGDDCSPVCSPACFRQPPIESWQKLERAFLMRGADELRAAAARACPEPPAGNPESCPARHETKPALQPRKQWTSLADLTTQFGAPSHVEAGTFEGKPVNRVFWGPIFLVVGDTKAPPLAQGVDRILAAVAAGRPKVDGIEYASLPGAAAGTLLVEGTPEGARVEVTEASSEPREAKTPARLDGLPVGTYQVLVEAPGHHRFERAVFVEPGFSARLQVKLERVLAWEAVAESAGSTVAKLREAAGGARPQKHRFEQPLGKAKVRVEDLAARHGAPREESGLRDGKPVRLFFWGPVFVVRLGPGPGPTGLAKAVGLDLLAEKLERAGPSAVDETGLTYRAQAGEKTPTCGLEVTGPVDAEVRIVGPSGEKLKGRLPFKSSLPPGP